MAQGLNTRVVRHMVVLAMILAALTPFAGPMDVSAAGPNLVVNGDFEAVPNDADAKSDNCCTLAANGWDQYARIPGWTAVDGFGIELQTNRVAGTAHSGTQKVELASNFSGGMYQDLPTLPGGRYRVTFFYSARPNTPEINNRLQVSWNGAPLAAPYISASGEGVSTTRWSSYTFDVVGGPAATSRLTFARVGVPGESSCCAGTLIDTVSVVEADADYLLCVLYDQTKAHKGGATIPLKLQLCDAHGTNHSSDGIVLHAASLVRLDNTASALIEDAGQANPGDDFRYDPALGGTGGYVFNKSTQGLTTGTWKLSFTVAGVAHPTYFVLFDVR